VNTLGAWTQPLNDILPQAVGTNAGTDTTKINVGDARIGNCVLRNGNLYYAQTIGLPAGGTVVRTAAQWVKLDTAGNFVDGGRVDDPTATATNGGNWYAYPSVAVNVNNDVLMGFTQFASDQFPSAGYTYRFGTDGAGTMRDPNIYKAGEGYYNKIYSGTRNRWGDYSQSSVDPSNDLTIWTLQEYSKPEGSPFAATGTNSGVWGTWWARITGSTTGADVVSFAAKRGSTGNVLTWRTATETRIAGFNVWRGTKRVNAHLIPAKRSGQATGASYRFVDRARPNSHYRLQVTWRSGARTWYTG
jgi:hypothetical protein